MNAMKSSWPNIFLTHIFPAWSQIILALHLFPSFLLGLRSSLLYISIHLFLALHLSSSFLLGLILAFHLSPSFLLGLSRPSCLPQLSGGLRHPGSSWRCGGCLPRGSACETGMQYHVGLHTIVVAALELTYPRSMMHNAHLCSAMHAHVGWGEHSGTR